MTTWKNRGKPPPSVRRWTGPLPAAPASAEAQTFPLLAAPAEAVQAAQTPAALGMPDTSIGPVALQQPAHWAYDFDPATGVSRAFYLGEVTYGLTPGGGGSFLSTAGGTMTGPLIYTATGGTVARAAQDRAIDVANVLDFGADPSGSLDSAAAINAACAYAPMAHAGSKSVYLPAGKYYIRSPINVQAGTTLYGDGRANTVIAAGSDFQSAATGVIILNGREGGAPIVRDLSINMTAPLDATTTASAAAAIGATTITLASAANVHVNDYVWDTTNSAAIAPWTLVTAIAGNVITIAPAVASPGVSNGDAMSFSPSRARFQTLANGGTTGFAGNSGCMYPPVINANAANRFVLRNMWITGAWDAIVQNSATTANGGGYIHAVQVSAFNTGFNFDNLTDFLSMSDVSFGGYTISNVKAGQQGGVFMDGQTQSFVLGRIDGANLTNVTLWQGNMHWIAGSQLSQDPHIINGMVIDSAAINIDNANTVMFNALSTIAGGFGKANTTPVLNIAGGRILLAGTSYVVQNSTSAPTINITGGSLNVGGAAYIAQEGVTQAAIAINAGGFTMIGGSIINHNASNTSAALVQQSGTGWVQIRSVSFGGGIGNPVGVSIGAANALNDLQQINWSNYTYTLQGGVAGIVGNTMYWGTPGTYQYVATPGVKAVKVICVGAGGGGGGGARTASGTASSGGGGGGGASRLERTFTPSQFGSAATITIGAGGTGGAAAAADNTNGTVGNPGGNTSFGSLIQLGGGGGGQGGASSAATGGGGGGGLNAQGSPGSAGTGGAGGGVLGAQGGSGSGAATVATLNGGGGGGGCGATGIAGTGGYTNDAGNGGASGGGITSAAGSNNGGGPNRYPITFAQSGPAGGSSGTPNGGTAAPGFTSATGVGGGGGYGNGAGAGGTGGLGTAGGGGGGGGSCINGNAAGAGGNGGNGFVFIEELF